MGKAAGQLIWLMKGRSKLAWFGTADHAAPTARTMRTNTASLRSVLPADTRLFQSPTPNEKVARTSTRERRWKRNKTKKTNNAGRFVDRADALAGEICGLFMKTRRGGSQRRGKQSPRSQ